LFDKTPIQGYEGLSQKRLHLLKCSDEHLVFIIRMGPGDVPVLKDIRQDIGGLLTVFGVKEI